MPLRRKQGIIQMYSEKTIHPHDEHLRQEEKEPGHRYTMGADRMKVLPFDAPNSEPPKPTMPKTKPPQQTVDDPHRTKVGLPLLSVMLKLPQIANTIH